MARIRSVKPELWHDPEFVNCTPLARLLWIGSWNLADDQGVLKDEPTRLRLAILPGDQVDAEALVEELVRARLLLRKRTTDGQAVLVIRTFREHQKIDTRREGKWGDPDDLLDPGTLDECLALNGTGSHPPAQMRASPRPSAPDRDHTIKEGIKDPGRDQGRDQGSLSSPRAKTEPPEFAAFWANYPKKKAKADALKAWPKAIKKADPAVLIDAASDFAISCQGKDPQFIPYPATWLNREQWADEPDPVRPPNRIDNGRGNTRESLAAMTENFIGRDS